MKFYDDISDTSSSEFCDSDNDTNNTKRILCYNIVTRKKCHYGKMCMYAHSVNEQVIDKIRKKAYDLIKNKISACDVNLLKDTDLFNELKQLTKLCKCCDNEQCSGGYNCKYGVFNKKYQVCYNDLMYGNCKKKSCKLVHLTKFKLICYNTQVINAKKPNVKLEKLINHDIFNYNDDSSIITDISDSSNEFHQKLLNLNNDVCDENLSDLSDYESIFID